MQHQFKPGDLALTLSPCGEIPAGSVVEFIRIMPAGEIFTMNGTDYHHDHDTNLVEKDSRRYLYRIGQLMPLRDDRTPQLEKQKEVEHG